jgi:carboxymethylenebutenolidase
MALIRTNMIPLSVNGDGARGYLAQPGDDQRHPGVVLIQEWWGVEPHIIGLAQKLALEGFVTLVPDLYHGRVVTEPDDARREVMLLMSSIQKAMAEIHGALQVLMELPEVDPKKIGVIGFCMGGRLTYQAAQSFPEVGAAVPFYGGNYNPTPEEVAGVKAPVCAFYGEHDAGIPLEQIRKIEDLYRAAGKDYQAKIYPAGHAFINSDHGGYHAESARQAWDEAVAFLKQHLQ